MFFGLKNFIDIFHSDDNSDRFMGKMLIATFFSIIGFLTLSSSLILIIEKF